MTGTAGCRQAVICSPSTCQLRQNALAARCLLHDNASTPKAVTEFSMTRRLLPEHHVSSLTHLPFCFAARFCSHWVWYPPPGCACTHQFHITDSTPSYAQDNHSCHDVRHLIGVACTSIAVWSMFWWLAQANTSTT